MTMPELALRFILLHPAVRTVIPGMRKLKHVERTNLAASPMDGPAISAPGWPSSGGTKVDQRSLCRDG